MPTVFSQWCRANWNATDEVPQHIQTGSAHLASRCGAARARAGWRLVHAGRNRAALARRTGGVPSLALYGSVFSRGETVRRPGSARRSSVAGGQRSHQFPREARLAFSGLACSRAVSRGSAVAHGFLGVPGIRVVILYPSKRISEAQEKQFTTLGENITALEVSGSFDDCQRLVKQAFSDAELNQRAFLTSANSINIGRLLPQMFYHVAAYRQLPVASVPLIVSVPSGNFGNLTAGIFAKRIGLPVARFVASTNVNDIVPQYLRTGEFHPRAAQSTFSNAMDVGNPNNFPRLLDLCRNRLEYVQREIWGHSATDDETLAAMKSVHERFHYIADPHTTVGVLGWEAYRREHPEPAQGLVLATA